MKKSLLEIVNQILDESGRDTLSALESNMDLRRDLHLDSLELAVLTVQIEAEWGVDVFAEGLVNTIGEVQARMKSES